MIFIFILSTTLLLSHACKTDLDCSLNGVCDVQTGTSVSFLKFSTLFFMLNSLTFRQKRVSAILGFQATNSAEQ